MPSPVAHLAVGYLVYRVARHHMPEEASSKLGPVSLLLVATLGLSVLPDLDVLPGLLVRNIGGFHNTVASSLFAAIVVSLFIGSIAGLRKRSAFMRWFVLSFSSYSLHIIMDWLTVGRGVMFFWPISSERYVAPVKLFWGLHWSDGLWSSTHLVTLASELGLVLVVFLGLVAWNKFSSRG